MAKRAFDHCAGDYARYRPSYPDALFDELIGVGGGLAADVGAGTGIFTRGLLARGWRVVAIEPSTTMLGEMRVGDGLHRVAATAERTGLSDGSADLVTCAQSFHWFNPPFAFAEFGRIIKPGGRLLLTWNNRDASRSGFVAAFEALVATFNPSYRREYRQQDWAGKLAKAGGFTPAEHYVYQHVWRIADEDFVGFTRSVSYIRNVLSREDRPRFEEALRALMAEHVAGGMLAIPLRTDAWIATRLAD